MPQAHRIFTYSPKPVHTHNKSVTPKHPAAPPNAAQALPYQYPPRLSEIVYDTHTSNSSDIKSTPQAPPPPTLHSTASYVYTPEQSLPRVSGPAHDKFTEYSAISNAQSNADQNNERTAGIGEHGEQPENYSRKYTAPQKDS